MPRRRSLIPAAACALLGALLVAPGSASADTAQSFHNPTPITVLDNRAADLNPSAIGVTGLRGPATNIAVTLHGVSHTRPRDIDILLVAPGGAGYLLMSDACGDVAVTNFSWVLSTGSQASMPPGEVCGDVIYSPSNYGNEDDTYTDAPPPPHAWLLSLIQHKALNGTWRLYVMDDEIGHAGKIARGWSLTVTTRDVPMLLPGSGTFGLANPYPATETVNVGDKVVTDVNVSIPEFAHDRPEDADIALVGPRGQAIMLMSDACGEGVVSTALTFDDEAPAPLPIDSPTGCQMRVKPTDHEGGDVLPAPAPQATYSTSLSDLDFTDPNGEWRLYAADDRDQGDGYLGQSFRLAIQTRDKARIEVAEDAVQVAEGTTRAVKVTRSAPGGLGAATVKVASTPGSASAGSDFTPVSTTLQFAAGEREKTVVLDARADGLGEGAESYAVALSEATGDGVIGARSRIGVTIPASAGPVTPPPPPPTPVATCAGRRATIVGTRGRDRLRGTPRRDVIVALGGNDAVTGGRGNDLVCAGAGNDTVDAGAGNDTIDGGSGSDRLLGGPGNDRATGGLGNDRLAGGSGADRLSGGAGADVVRGDGGRDSCQGGPGRNRVSCERR